MKVKKQKRHRRAVRFYTACFGFRQPYKVFCDGTFVHHLISNRIVPADIALSNILGGTVKLFTSRCVLEELKRLGPSYSQDIEAAQKLTTARCDHEGIKSAEACITDIVGENNPEHFFIATQDAELRNKFQEVPGVPLIFGLRNALFLEKPSAFQHEFVKDRERDMLKKETGKILQTAESGTSAVEHEGPGDDCFARWDLQSKRYVRNGLDVKDKPKFKRKKAKGPNPLSCQKKKSANPKASVAKKHGS
ncbi:rRNA-processing protein UTP23 homolog [Linum perenne]